MHEEQASLAIPSIMCHPEQWSLIGTGFPSDARPVEHPRHRQWMVAHSHRHAHPEIMFVIGGRGHHGLGGQVYPIAPGSILVIAGFEEHDYNAPPWTGDSDHLWVMLVDDQCVVRRLRHINGLPCWSDEWCFFLAKEDTGLWQHACLKEIGAESPLPPIFRRLRAHAVVEQIVAAVAQAVVTERERSDSFQERIIATAQRYIRGAAGNGITLDHLARISGYSKFHFARLFRHYTGCSVHAFVDQCRAERVEAMLADGKTKTEIAYALGFSCQPAFSRWYNRRRVGSPDGE
jgi:AraC-like DNA-binding protein